MSLRYAESPAETELHHLGPVFARETSPSTLTLRQGSEGLDAGDAQWMSFSECQELR